MPVFIGSTPNSQYDDVSLSKDILKGAVAYSGSREILLEKLPHNSFLFNKGRDSLYFFLKLLNMNKEDEVIVQAFTCIAAVAPILWNNVKPVYVDIKEETFNMNLNLLEKAISEKTRAVIVQHTFGDIADSRKIRRIIDNVNRNRASDRKIFLIEDCAHLFSTKPFNLGIGEFSDAFFFSFSQDKSISCTQGAVLCISDKRDTEDILNRAIIEYKNIDELVVKEALYCARYVSVWDRIKKNYFKKILPFTNITIGRLLILFYRYTGIIKKQASIETVSFPIPHKMSDIQACLLLNQIEKSDIYNSHRIKVVQEYKGKLKKELQFKSNGDSLLRYPILLKNREEIKKRLLKEKIISGIWYSTIVFPLSNEELKTLTYYKSSSCPIAEKYSQNILNLPTNIEVDQEDVKKIINIVNDFAKPINI